MSDVPKLLAKQRQLMKHESLLNECLSIVRKERNKLQIEHLQLESMLAKVRCEASTEEYLSQAVDTSFQPLDLSSTSQINSQALDLSVGNSLSNMLEGRFFLETEEEEEDENGDEGSEELADDDYVLTLF